MTDTLSIPVEVKTSEIAERTKAFVEELRRNNIVALPYRQAPVAKELFVLSVDPSNAIRLWVGLAEIKLFPDPDRRQAVLVVRERNRQVVRKYRLEVVRPYVWTGDRENERRDPTDGEIRSNARSAFPIQMPSGTTFEFTWKELKNTATNRRKYFTVTGAAAAPNTEQAFLVGMDETAQFVSALPSVVTSVAEADALLRPAEVPSGSPRQGEWFFVPVTEKEQEEIDKAIEGKSDATQVRIGSSTLEANSTHRALVCRLFRSSGKQRSERALLYAIGKVFDTRPGRHEPLVLPGWHRVIRNREVVAAEATPGNVQKRSGRSSARWD